MLVPAGRGCWLRPLQPSPSLPALPELQHIPASPDCSAVASAAGLHVLPRAGRRWGGSLRSLGLGWVWGRSLPPFHSKGGLLWSFTAGKGPGGPPGSSSCRDGDAGCTAWGETACACACVHTRVCAYLLPPSRGATAEVPPRIAPTSLPGATCSYLLLQVLNIQNIHISLFFSFCFFFFLHFWLCPDPDSLQCKTKCILKILK